MSKERARREAVLAQYKKALDYAQNAYDNGWKCGCGAINVLPHAPESLKALEEAKHDYERTAKWVEEVKP